MLKLNPNRLFVKIFTLCIVNCALCTQLCAQKEYSPIRRGNRDYKHDKFTEAEIDYHRGIDINSQSYEGHYNLGNAYYRQEKYSEAEEEFAKAIDCIDPKEDKERYAQTMHNIGNALFAQQQYDGAVAAYEESLRNNPKDNDTRYNLVKAQTLLEQQQNEKSGTGQQNQQQQNQNQSQQQEQEKQQQQEQDQMDKETAAQILQALEQDEQETQSKLQRQQGQKRTVEKDW